MRASASTGFQSHEPPARVPPRLSDRLRQKQLPTQDPDQPMNADVLELANMETIVPWAYGCTVAAGPAARAVVDAMPARYRRAMKSLVEGLCSDRCAGRAPGTPGGIAARSLVIDSLRERGLDLVEQPVPG